MKEDNKKEKNEESKEKESKEKTDEEYEKMILQYKKIKYSRYL